MSTPSEFDLLDLAVPYALDAVTDTQRADIEQRLAAAPRVIAEAFRAQVAEARSTMTALSAATAVPPPAALRDRVLGTGQPQPRRRTRWQKAVLAAAAVLIVGTGAFGAGWALRPVPAAPVAERVLTAPDVRAASMPLSTGGTATVVYSRQRGDGIVVLDNATVPPAGMAYQVWLMKDGVPVPAGSAGTGRTVMVTDIGRATALGVTVEPMHRTGAAPQGTMVARVALP
jgi:hypothetical protein